MHRFIIYALFLGSGITGLIYQVLWTRLLTLTFGVTTLAVSTVLTCFFGGLALGSFLGGRWIDRRGKGFFWYGVAEVVVGIYALVFLFLLGLTNTAYVSIAGSIEASFYGLSLLKFALAAVLLILPTTMMGATLPILSKTLADSRSRFGREVGNLYAVNTVGAVIGAVLTAFVLIPAFGIKAVIIAVGIVNIAMGAVAVYIGGQVGVEDETTGWHGAEAKATPEGQEEDKIVPQWFARLTALSFGLSGLTALAYEVIWTRVLGFILTGTIYAFAAVLAVFLTGIAAGSYVVSRRIDGFKSQSSLINAFALVEVLIGLLSTALIILYAKMPGFDFYHRITATADFSEFIWLNFFISFILLITPAFLFGMTFPLVCKIYGQRMDRVGAGVGDVYSANTVGGIIGSFAAGFLLIQFVGMQKSLVLMGWINVAIGAAFFVLNPFRFKSAYVYAVASFVCMAIIVAVLPANMPRALHESLLNENERMLFYEEGPAATVMIAERSGAGLKFSNKRLWVNGNMATAAFYEGLQINRFQGVLPMALHPDPKDVLVICFGSGTTFGTLSRFPVDGVDNVEIASTVVKGAPYFKSENSDVLNNPRSRIIIDDGRSRLEVTRKKYDVITQEPMHPLLAGVVNLYTREYYELAKSRLKKGGLVSQWIPLYNLSVEDLKMLVATFKSVFPHTTVWMVSNDIFMIGSEDEQRVDVARLRARLEAPDISRLLAEIDLDNTAEFLSTFLMNEEQTRAYAGNAPVVTDDRPYVEFTGPRSLGVNTISPNIAELVKFREPVSPYLALGGNAPDKGLLALLDIKFRARRDNLIGRAYYADGNFEKSSEYFNRALAVDSSDANSIHYMRKFGFYK